LHAYTFQIDPHARLGRRRSRLDRAKAARAAAGRIRRKPLAVAAPPQEKPARPLPLRVQSPKTHLSAIQSDYRGFRIACTALADGTWIANFARADGGPLSVNGVVQAVVSTRPYFSEVLATAEAQLRIDALANALQNQP
jgi:hypothetical protein